MATEPDDRRYTGVEPDPKRDERFPKFVEWLKTVPDDKLREIVMDAYWKGHLRTHEIHRAFIAETEKGIRLIPEKVK